jgi:hypothetical protein
MVLLLDGYSSDKSSVISGVPQGTVLGPLTFLLYVNDIADKISPQTRIKLFADDCLLYRTIDTVKGPSTVPWGTPDMTEDLSDE